MQKLRWMWNEWQQIGTDYDNIDQVEAYEKRMGQFRDFDRENGAVLEVLGLKACEGCRIVEIGTGTGHFARFAALSGFQVTAVDISQMMLDYASQAARNAGIPKDRIEFIHGGFLGPDFPQASFDAAYTSAALHHLPDIWKVLAVERICRLLRTGGQFILRDVVFDWNEGEHAAFFEDFVSSFPESTQEPAARHAAREYSTTSWLLRSILTHSGFEVLKEKDEGHCLRLFHCRKK